MRIVVGVSGASGMVYAARLLRVLREMGHETHLVGTSSAKLTLQLELPELPWESVRQLATHSYKENDISAPIASGGLRVDAMVIVPCSMKTLAAVAVGYGNNLLTRAADVTLKERRRLIVVPREAPFHLGHLRNMVALSEMGAVILAPVPAFYLRPQTVGDIVDHTVGKILDLMSVEHTLVQAWEGPGAM